jgi:NAD(P)-dependent dehydrogenase (short-subunit alcohol dehydrogenase family)
LSSVICLRSSGSPGKSDVGRNFEGHAKVLGFAQLQAKLSEGNRASAPDDLPEVANPAVFVASNQASAVTGTTVNLWCGGGID